MNLIERLETKYELDGPTAADLGEIVGRHLPCYEYTEGYPYTYVTTVYFDTDRLDFFRRAVRFRENHVKLRVREYSYRQDNGDFVLLPYCYVEIKRRTHGTVVKRRFRLAKGLLGSFLRGDDVSRHVDGSDGSDGPSAPDSDRAAYQEVRQFVELARVFPKSVIQYRRRVYQSKLEEIRITFDDQLTIASPRPDLFEASETLRPPDSCECRRLDKVIMEVKCRNPDASPAWLEDLLRSFVPCSISKFTESMSALAR